MAQQNSVCVLSGRFNLDCRWKITFASGNICVCMCACVCFHPFDWLNSYFLGNQKNREARLQFTLVERLWRTWGFWQVYLPNTEYTFDLYSAGIPLSSVWFSHSVLSDSLWPHGLQHARLPCPSPTPGAYSHSCPSSWSPSNHLILTFYRRGLILPRNQRHRYNFYFNNNDTNIQRV